MTIWNIGKEGNNDGRQGVNECGKGDIAEDSQ